MDKNHINIDDLFRNRLSGGEEKERPGAWLAMRDLLDKEMPVQAAFNWRRMFGIITALVVATSVSVGGYKYYAHRSGTGIAANSPLAFTSTPKNTFTSTSQTPGNSTNNAPLNSPTEATVNHASNNIVAAELATNATNTPKKSKNTNRTNANKGTQNGRATNGTVALNDADNTGNAEANTSSTSGNTNSNIGIGNRNNSGVEGHVSAHKTTHPVSLETASHNTATSGSSRHLVASNASSVTPGATTSSASGENRSASAPAHVAKTNSTKSEQPKNNDRTFGSSYNRNDVGRNVNIPGKGADALAHNNTATTTTTGKDQTAFVLRRDTIQQIEIVFRRVENPITQKMQYRPDTIARERYVVERLVPIGTPEFAPASAASSDAASDNNLVSLSKFKVSSKFHNAWVNNSERFNQFVKNVTFTMAKAQFYGGITGGFNSSIFSANTLAGFQLGVSGLLAFNERWSIGGEFKFYQRFNNGSSINDNYTKGYGYTPGGFSTQNGQQVQAWTWYEDKTTHYYNLTTVQTIEAPLTLRRNIGRIFGEVGLNMMYAFAINAEEIDRADGKPTLISRNIPVGSTPEAINSGRAQVNPADFGSRFGLGYVIGAGYQFSPALNANIKLVQNVWDDASSDGARKVSRNLYQTPSLQLSVGYRFSHKRDIKPQVNP